MPIAGNTPLGVLTSLTPGRNGVGRDEVKCWVQELTRRAQRSRTREDEIVKRAMRNPSTLTCYAGLFSCFMKSKIFSACSLVGSPLPSVHPVSV
jgi:hypothetical protein